MKSLQRIALIAIAGAIVSPVAAQGEQPTNYIFDDELVDGDFVRSDLEVLRSRTRQQRTSLIRTRGHFVPEMLQSVENL